MSKICFVQHASESPLYESIADALSARGVDAVFVCKMRLAQQQYEASGRTTLYPEEVFANEPLADEVLKELDERYGTPGLRLILDSDVQLQRLYRTEKERLDVIARTLLFWERVISEEGIDAVLARESATFLTRTAYLVCRARKIPFGQLAIGPSNDMFTIDDVDESHVWSRFLDALKKSPSRLTDAEAARIEAFIAKRIPASSGPMRVRFVPDSLFSVARQFLSLRLHDTPGLMKSDPIRVGSLRYGRYRLLKRLVWQYVTRLFFTYDEPHEGDSYVYFPFYSGEETSYLVSDRFWALREVELLKEAARCLPYGHLLYVKEHPTNPGDLSFRELNELRRVPNIRILHPSVSARDVIAKSSAVCVLQGTTGWEAFLMQKPVVTLSRPFFAYAELVYAVRDIADLPHIFKEAIAAGSKRYEKTRDSWQWFIHTALTTAYEGETLRLEPPYGFPDEPENGRRIADAIRETLLAKAIK